MIRILLSVCLTWLYVRGSSTKIKYDELHDRSYTSKVFLGFHPVETFHRRSERLRGRVASNLVGLERSMCPALSKKLGINCTRAKKEWHLNLHNRWHSISVDSAFGSFGAVARLELPSRFPNRFSVMYNCPPFVSAPGSCQGQLSSSVSYLALKKGAGPISVEAAHLLNRIPFTDDGQRLQVFPYVVDIFDRGGVPPFLDDALITEWVDGFQMSQIMNFMQTKRRNKDARDAAVRVMYVVCKVLSILHNKGVEHNDLSPPNIKLQVSSVSTSSLSKITTKDVRLIDLDCATTKQIHRDVVGERRRYRQAPQRDSAKLIIIMERLLCRPFHEFDGVRRICRTIKRKAGPCAYPYDRGCNFIMGRNTVLRMMRVIEEVVPPVVLR